MDNANIKRVSVLIIMLFFIIEYILRQKIDALFEYSGYLAEITYIFITMFVFRDHIKTKKIVFNKNFNLLLISAFFFGYFSMFFAHRTEIVVPFDFNSKEVLIFLLLVGPIVEELLFREAIWTAFNIIGLKNGTVILTSLMFSFSHFYSVWSAPPVYEKFIMYQSVYTLILAFLCAAVRIMSNVGGAILLHLVFNFGFWCFTLL